MDGDEIFDVKSTSENLSAKKKSVAKWYVEPKLK